MSRLALLVILMAATACQSDSDPTGPEPLLSSLPRALTSSETRLIAASNRFTFDLFREASRGLPPGENAFLSPLSASMALGMALNGSAGPTLDAMRSGLRLGEEPLSEINKGYRDLLTLFTGLDRSTEILVANSVWVDQGFPVRADFLATVREWFQAEARTLDLQAPETVGEINGWVRTKTRERIPTLLESVDPNEISFLINAIYFKGRWRIPFDPKQTSPQAFTGADGVARNVPTMQLDEPVRFASRQGYQAAELLYGNGAFAMTILLPDEGSTPAAVLATLSPESWAELDAALVEAKIILAMPRFRLEYKRSLVDDLTALGMGIAFDPTRADFSGIADLSAERLYLTRVLQKSFVEVNEEGTEAAAATVVGVGVTSMPPSVIVNRPFLFVIRERLSGTILFLGQINKLG